MNLVLVGILVSLVFAGITFIATQNFLSTILIFIIYNAFFLFVARRLLKKNQQKIHRYHQFYQFINTFVISLNVKGSLNAALSSAYETSDSGTKEIMDSITEFNEEEKISYLSKYFKFDLYNLFVDTIKLWNEEGGDILKMSRYLIDQARYKEEYLLNCQSLNKSKTIEFVVLWVIALAILTALRFALSQFFSYVIKTLFYQIAVPVLLLFVLFSIFLLLMRISNINLEGWRDEQK